MASPRDRIPDDYNLENIAPYRKLYAEAKARARPRATEPSETPAAHSSLATFLASDAVRHFLGYAAGAAVFFVMGAFAQHSFDLTKFFVTFSSISGLR